MARQKHSPYHAGANDQTAGRTPMKNHFTMSRIGEMDIQCVPFLKSKRRFR